MAERRVQRMSVSLRRQSTRARRHSISGHAATGDVDGRSYGGASESSQPAPASPTQCAPGGKITLDFLLLPVILSK